ncbi:hypothetical protein AVEN_52997-1 [Araneus ventricosus]|uniref:Uncharacterized protein n=1 Tax=Araneus ventricosus TaxID=182803 RepID=A0A4Y2P0N1_ARAVE|nr:hypothetical protein AVEN_52997-1 [Araneus ventricosus]
MKSSAGHSRTLLSTQIRQLHDKSCRACRNTDENWSSGEQKLLFPASLDIQQLHLYCRAINAERRSVQIRVERSGALSLNKKLEQAVVVLKAGDSQPFSMKWPSGVPWCMTTTRYTTYVVEKCNVMWKLPHPVLTGGSERKLRKLTFGNDLSNYNVG